MHVHFDGGIHIQMAPGNNSLDARALEQAAHKISQIVAQKLKDALGGIAVRI